MLRVLDVYIRRLGTISDEIAFFVGHNSGRVCTAAYALRGVQILKVTRYSFAMGIYLVSLLLKIT